MKNLNSNFFNGFLVLEENYYREFSVKLHVLQRKHLNIYLKNTSRFQKILTTTQYVGYIQLSYETFPSFIFGKLAKLQAKKRFCPLKISTTVQEMDILQKLIWAKRTIGTIGTNFYKRNCCIFSSFVLKLMKLVRWKVKPNLHPRDNSFKFNSIKRKISIHFGCLEVPFK